jgi:hypothetical protein
MDFIILMICLMILTRFRPKTYVKFVTMIDVLLRRHAPVAIGKTSKDLG